MFNKGLKELEMKYSPETWAWAIFIVAIGLGLGYSCSGIHEDPILRGCKDSRLNPDRASFVECVKARTGKGD